MSLWVLINDSNQVIEIHEDDISGTYGDKAISVPSSMVPFLNNVNLTYDPDTSTWGSTDLASVKKNLKDKLAALRYKYEVGGVIDSGNNNIIIASDRMSQASINGAFLWLQDNTESVVSFKDYTGWVDLNLTNATSRKNQVLSHVQGCFSREKAINDIIDAAADLTTLVTNYNNAIDSGWPTSSYHKAKVDANTDIALLTNWNTPGFA